MEDMKYDELIDLGDGGTLEIFENKDKSAQIETKTGKILKSQVLYLVLPGGGYEILVPCEIYPVAEKYISLGFSSAILKYTTKKPYPLSYNQGLKSIELLSSKFKKIIIIGFSAGGHLAGLLGTTEREKLFNAVGMILCYPVITLGKITHEGTRQNFFGNKIENNLDNQKLFSIDNRVNSKTLPTFIWTCKPDKIVNYQNTEIMVEKLKENKVMFDYRIFETGEHGIVFADRDINLFGLYIKKDDKVATWLNSALDFMERVIKDN